MRLLVAWVCCSLLAAPAAARSFAEIKKDGRLLVATSIGYEPYIYEKDGKLIGFEVELAEAIARKLGLKVIWKDLPFSLLLSEVNKKPAEIDMVVGSHTITSTRMNEVSFSKPHYCTSEVILSRQGGPRVTKELSGRMVGAELGSINLGFLKKLPLKMTIRTYTSMEDSLTALLNGKLDATVLDMNLASDFIKANPTVKLQMGPAIWKTQAGLVFAKSDSTNELRAAVNVALNELLRDGTYTTLSMKYLGRDIRC